MPRTKTKGSTSVSPKRQVKAPSKSSPSIKITAPAKRVEKGRMTIDSEQMIKDLVELGRIKDDKKDHSHSNKSNSKKSVNSFIDLSNSPLLNFIQEKNHGSYFKIALAFLAVVVLFFLSILYVVNSKAVINIVLKKTEGATSNGRKKIVNSCNPRTINVPRANIYINNFFQKHWR